MGKTDLNIIINTYIFDTYYLTKAYKIIKIKKYKYLLEYITISKILRIEQSIVYLDSRSRVHSYSGSSFHVLQNCVSLIVETSIHSSFSNIIKTSTEYTERRPSVGSPIFTALSPRREWHANESRKAEKR